MASSNVNQSLAGAQLLYGSPPTPQAIDAATQTLGTYAPQDSSGYGTDYTTQDLTPPSAPTPPSPVLESSPEWNAYLNALGLQKNQFASDIQRQRDIARASAQFQSQSLTPQFDQQRRGITASAEGRGMARSGQLQRNLAENRASQGVQQTGIQNALNTQLSDLEASLAQKNVDLATQQAQQRATMVGQGYVSNGFYDPGFDYSKFQKAAQSGYFG